MPFKKLKCHFFLMLTSITLTLGCQERVQWIYEDSPQTIPSFSKKNKDFFVETDFNHQNQSYQHIIQWNFKNPHTFFFIYTLHDGHKNLIHQSKKLKGKITFSDFPTTTSLSYISERFDENFRLIESEIFTVPTPKDYIFEGETILTEDLILDHKSGYKKVIFKGGTTIQTQQFNLLIDVDQISFGESVKIENFKAETQASPGVSGRHGGNIKIVSKKAKGHLKILLSGENGGQGIQPKNRPPSPPRAPSGKFADTVTCSLERKAQNGQPGSRGLSGNDGLSGGDTGSLYVEVNQGDLFHLETEYQPGLGGSGSLGGPGALGGQPGQRARRFRSLSRDACQEKTIVSPGATGSPGPSGKKGRSGQKQPICIKIANQTTFPCLKETLTWKTK